MCLLLLLSHAHTFFFLHKTSGDVKREKKPTRTKCKEYKIKLYVFLVFFFSSFCIPPVTFYLAHCLSLIWERKALVLFMLSHDPIQPVLSLSLSLQSCILIVISPSVISLVYLFILRTGNSIILNKRRNQTLIEMVEIGFNSL